MLLFDRQNSLAVDVMWKLLSVTCHFRDVLGKQTLLQRKNLSEALWLGEHDMQLKNNLL